MLKPAAEEAGAPWASFHTFRHTCAAMLFECGLNVKQVQRSLGHDSPSFTLDTYIHLLRSGYPSRSVWAASSRVARGGNFGRIPWGRAPMREEAETAP